MFLLRHFGFRERLCCARVLRPFMHIRSFMHMLYHRFLIVPVQARFNAPRAVFGETKYRVLAVQHPHLQNFHLKLPVRPFDNTSANTIRESICCARVIRPCMHINNAMVSAFFFFYFFSSYLTLQTVITIKRADCRRRWHLLIVNI
jgi:hypothetical protein